MNAQIVEAKQSSSTMEDEEKPLDLTRTPTDDDINKLWVEVRVRISNL